VACVGSITVAARGAAARGVAGRICDSCATSAARGQSAVLATGFFTVPPHRKRKVALTLTQLGKDLLQPGARVPVRVTVVSFSPTGRSLKHVYSEVLER
jgi:hypothetical protein